jgi:hypothetical protein
MQSYIIYTDTERCRTPLYSSIILYYIILYHIVIIEIKKEEKTKKKGNVYVIYIYIYELKAGGEKERKDIIF